MRKRDERVALGEVACDASAREVVGLDPKVIDDSSHLVVGHRFGTHEVAVVGRVE
jgi:hypothetical protein